MDHKRNDCINVGRFVNGGLGFQIHSPTQNQQISNLVATSLKTNLLVLTHVKTNIKNWTLFIFILFLKRIVFLIKFRSYSQVLDDVVVSLVLV
jgi:hypothetical protein